VFSDPKLAPAKPWRIFRGQAENQILTFAAVCFASRPAAGSMLQDYPWRWLCFVFSQITRTTPRRWMTLHLSQIFFTDARTFMFSYPDFSPAEIRPPSLTTDLPESAEVGSSRTYAASIRRAPYLYR
jgi:hypothetical protein